MHFKALDNIKYKVLKTYPPHKMSMPDILNNHFSNLENYEKMAFKFIDYPDQMLLIADENNARFKVFGECLFGLLVVDEKDTVRLLTDDESFIDQEVYVNNSIDTFVQSYCLFLSKIFILKANTYRENKLTMVAHKCSDDLTSEINTLDPHAIHKDNLWDMLIYMIDDLGIKLNSPIIDYIDDGRL